jgi:hypothetical protein
MKKSLLIVAVLFTLTACQRPVFTFEVITPAAEVSPTPWAAGTETALAAASPTFTPGVSGAQTAAAQSSQTPFTPDPLTGATPTPVNWPRDFSHVLYAGKFYQTTFFLLLGGVNIEAWLPPDESLRRYAGEATYSLHTLTQEYKYLVWGKVPELSRVCQAYSVRTEANLDDTGFVAVMDGWNITQRAVTELSPDVQPYRQAALDWLKAEGLPATEINQFQIQRVDLEGDGVDEVFISATRYNELERITKTGDHSVILMRKVQGNEVVTTLIAGEVYRGPETATLLHDTYSIANFIDLNQDGVLEVVVDIRRWEGFGANAYPLTGGCSDLDCILSRSWKGFGAAVYQVEDQSVTQVLHAGCGL